MKAQGEHLLIQTPRKRDMTAQGLMLPDDVGKTFSYGRVESIGDLAAQKLSDIHTGDYVTFDQMGARALLLDPLKDDGLFTIHWSQVFTTVAEKQLTARKLPVPE